MTYTRLIAMFFFISAGSPIPSLAADVYWTHTYQGITVTSDVDAEHAKSLADNLHRLDLATTRLLSLDHTEWRPPIQVFLMPGKTFALMTDRPGNSGTIYMASSVRTTILLEAGGRGFKNPSFGAYFGFAGSLLNGGLSARFPRWFVIGLSEVLGSSSVERERVVIGGFEPGRVRELARGTWIPTKTLLNIHAEDPQMKSPDFYAMYEAESWFLAHQIMVEGLYRTNFLDYFSRLDQGEAETQAFAESFSIAYEDIDKKLYATMNDGRLNTVAVKVTDEPDSTPVRALSNSEASGMLAIVAAQAGAPVENVMRLAKESLAEDSHSPNALIAISLLQLRGKDYAGARQTAASLCAGDSLPQPSAAACGNIYAELAYNAAVNSKAEIPAFSGQAVASFEAAVTMDPDDVLSWTRYATLFLRTHDLEGAKAFLPRMRHVWALHSRNEELARAAAALCEMTGDYDSALQFASAWRRHALTGASRDKADAYIGRLKIHVDRKRTEASGDATPPLGGADANPSNGG